MSETAPAPRRQAQAGGLFVTGTGTEVGKSVVAAAIARTAASRGERVAVFKPALSGLDQHRDSDLEPDHDLLRRAARSAQSADDVAPYRYGAAVSPHLGAELAGEPIDCSRLVEAARRASAGVDLLVCEGVGGLLVPLFLGEAGSGSAASAPTSEPVPLPYLVRDFARDLGLPVVIAAPPGLGTINHTLLTIEAARAAGLEVASVVLTPWPERPSMVEASNRKAIARLGELPVFVLPPLDLADPDSWPALDPRLG